MFSQSSTEEDGPALVALSNSLTLQKIFANIRTSFLLTSCSLVNKTWNTGARKFLRTHRICAARNNSETTACEFLQELDLLCGQIKNSGRVIPFNYLKIDFSKRCCAKKSRSEEILYSNVISELKITGPIACISQNYDAEFCGISWEEAEWLGEGGDDYLKKVHIVPIKPCLRTLPSKCLNVQRQLFLKL